MSAEKKSDQPYVALARRYRPVKFADFVGLEHVTRTLQNSIEQGRVGHAYLFCGPRGIGKTSMVRVFAAALNCEVAPPTEPCGKCDSCLSVHRGDGIDVVEIDGASHTGVDDIRELREHALYAPAKSKHKIFVIDEVHMLSKSAFNALLKTLEEPPAHVKFLFATTEPRKLPETILSRCQRFDFPRISARDITEVLKRICRDEGVAAEEETLAHIARNVRGGLRDSLSVLDQIIAHDGSNIHTESVYEVMGSVPDGIIADLGSAITAGDIKTALQIVGDAIFKGKEISDFAEALSNFFRDVLLLRACGQDFDGFITGPAAREKAIEAAHELGDDTIIYIQQVLFDLRGKLRFAPNPSVLLETTAVRLCRWRDYASFGALLRGYKPREAETPDTRTKKKTEIIPREYAETRENPPAAHEDDLLPERQIVPPDIYAPTPASSGGIIDEEAWQNALNKIYNMKGFLGTILGNAKFLGSSNGTITLGFTPEWRFSREQLEDPPKLAEAQERLTDIFGHPITLKSSNIEDEKTAKIEKKAAIKYDPLIEKALDMFKGEIIDNGTTP